MIVSGDGNDKGVRGTPPDRDACRLVQLIELDVARAGVATIVVTMAASLVATDAQGKG